MQYDNVLGLCAEFYEELLSLVYSLTSRQISTYMWHTLPHLYRLFYDDNIDLFVGEHFSATLLMCTMSLPSFDRRHSTV